MSNLFKSNSRFASLAEDISVDNSKKDKVWKKEKTEKKGNELSKNNDNSGENNNNKFNSFKDEPQRETTFRDDRNFNGRSREFDEKQKLKRQQERERLKVSEENQREKEKEASININNFPELVSNHKQKNNNIQPKIISFADKLKKDEFTVTNKNNAKDTELENLPYGWAILKKDPFTGNTIIKQHPEKPIRKKTEAEVGRDILRALVTLHDKRTKEYIDTYGEYAWEKMFKRPHWREEELENMSDSDDEDNDDENEEMNDSTEEEYYR